MYYLDDSRFKQLSLSLAIIDCGTIAAASSGTHWLLLPVCCLSSNPSVRALSYRATSSATCRRSAQNFAVALGDGVVDGEALALVLVLFYSFTDFPNHVVVWRPCKELCDEELVSAQKSHSK
jgi:hypothetical protein